MPLPYNYYDVLQLPQNNADKLRSEDVKAAYHRALLRSHPDKLQPSPGLTGTHDDNSDIGRYSIDEIVSAYQTLVDRDKRASYDRSLKLGPTNARVAEANKSAHAGVESFDLEELQYDERLGGWHKQCRCGNEDGYVVTEEDLEKEIAYGEIYVGCKGCSLFIRVLFDSVDGPESNNGTGNASTGTE